MTDKIQEQLNDHALKIKELDDAIYHKNEKIEEIIQKLDNLTDELKKIQVDNLNLLSERITRLESAQSTMKWVTAIGLSALTTAVGVITLFLTIIK